MTAPSYSIANNPGVVHPGDQFTVYLLLDLGDHFCVGHEVSVSFSPGKLAVLEVLERGVPPFEMNLSPGVRAIDNMAGTITQIEGASLYEVLEPRQRFVVAEILFEAISVGMSEIRPFFHQGAAVIDERGAIEGVTFEPAHVDIVSERRKKLRGTKS